MFFACLTFSTWKWIVLDIMTLGKDAVLHLNSNSSKAEERRPRTIGLLLLCNHITAFLTLRFHKVFFSKLKKKFGTTIFREKQLNRDFRTTLISLFRAAQSYFFWNSIAQKNPKLLDKTLPYEARAEFCLIFRSFFGQ